MPEILQSQFSNNQDPSATIKFDLESDYPCTPSSLSQRFILHCTSVSDQYFYEELLLTAGPEVCYEWLSMHSKRRTSRYLKDLNLNCQQIKMTSPVSRLKHASPEIKTNLVECRVEDPSVASIGSNEESTSRDGMGCPRVPKSMDVECGPRNGDKSARAWFAKKHLLHSASAPELHGVNSECGTQVVLLSKSYNSANMGLLFTDAAHTLLE
jgi:hypothetical protein